MVDVIRRYSGFWEGGRASLVALKQLLNDTKAAVHSHDERRRFPALVARASGYYTRFNDVTVLLPGRVRMLWKAKSCLRKALGYPEQVRRLLFSANRLDVLSTVALRGIRVLWIGLGPLAPDPTGAIRLADRGLAVWAEENPEERAAHTYALLLLDRIEALLLLGFDLEADELRETLEKFILENDIPDEQQYVRVLKRLGKVSWELGFVLPARVYLDEAEELAQEVSADQLGKIRALRRHLLRPWWHPLKWLIQIS